jgi:hypothetical protein
MNNKQLSADNYTDNTTYGSGILRRLFFYNSIPVFLRIKDDNTNLIYQYSMDNVHYVTWATQARTAHMASANQVILGCNVTNLNRDCYNWFLHYNETQP